MKTKSKLVLLVTALTICACGSGQSKNANADPNANPMADLNQDFDIAKYQQAFIDKAELHFLSNDGEIRLVKYALIDVDHDGKPEVWVKGDDGESYQGVYAIDGDNVTLLGSGDTCTDLVFYKDAVGYDSYWDFTENEGATMLKNSKPTDSYTQCTEINPSTDDENVVSCTINEELVDSATCYAFLSKLGQRILSSDLEKEVTWHDIVAPYAD